jgi:hypothetical protein
MTPAVPVTFTACLAGSLDIHVPQILERYYRPFSSFSDACQFVETPRASKERLPRVTVVVSSESRAWLLPLNGSARSGTILAARRPIFSPASFQMRKLTPPQMPG